MKLTDEMKDLIKVQLSYIATVDEQGNPNIGPKRTMRVLDDTHLIFCENTNGQHHANIKANGKISVAFVDREANKGFRFTGKATSYTDQAKMDLAKELVGTAPKAAAVIIDIEKMYTLDSGPLAGKLIEE
ncbi:pyridoxamine 5'-phosphate oxidase family protein [Megasphaera sp. UPII 135-E]|uniref:pyridoxamine 5'-phosphate oxidase family protein n=1 Tax=Megasphaera sp. UPII 135-E TaxID=1000569 RepID=UPI00021A193B|nr:pyridoxamine 5'-phosphate oxidase family protein [Megasphaera sp. UPII 135-E]EGS36720.1 pyridoxamine 5'-phosphate oxidase family protein [Megasphaera sp. UPII 135-E]MCT7757038.1 pyridoxamine 5'-phosphate oxidase family protein [Lactobacillus iners]MUP59288.1 flavin-nucleotide-binding protein [Veillonellaceae bacterium M2-4]